MVIRHLKNREEKANGAEKTCEIHTCRFDQIVGLEMVDNINGLRKNFLTILTVITRVLGH